MTAVPARQRMRSPMHRERCPPRVRQHLGSVGRSAWRARGFTLIEVLLATVLLAAGLALAFATLGVAAKSAQRGDLLAQRNERMRAVAGFLRSRIGSARPIAYALDPATGMSLRFLGASDRIRFVADLPDYLGRGGPYLHDIRVDDADDSKRLMVEFSLVQNGVALPEDPPRPPEPLAEALAGATFRYRGIGADGVLGDWQDQWTDAEQLPLQVSVQLATDSGIAWPELIIAVPLAGSVGLSGAAMSLSQ